MPKSAKLFHETYKHLTTLSSASILVVSSFLVKGGMEGAIAAYAAMVCMLACILCSLLQMLTIASGREPRVKLVLGRVTLTEALALFSFSGGIMCIVLFAKANFAK